MKRALPLLDSVRVASPCSADWGQMVGDEKVRFCTSCAKNVYNLSAMTSADAERLLGGGDAPCVRFYQRTDGTVLTTDCPVGVKRRRRKKVALAIAGAGAVAWAAIAEVERRSVLGGFRPPPEQIALAMEPAPLPVTVPTTPPVAAPLPPVEQGRIMLGGIAPDPQDGAEGQTTREAAHVRPLMGKPAPPRPKR